MKSLVYRAMAASLIFAFFAVVWGVAIEPRLIDEVEIHADLAGLPRIWEGREIALVADIQLGMWFGNVDTARRVFERIAKRRPAALLIAGDFIYHPTEDDSADEAREELREGDLAETEDLTRRAATLVAPVPNAGIPTFAVLGNHDYAMESESALKLPEIASVLSRELEKVGVKILRNEAAPLATSGEISPGVESVLYIVGIGPYYPHEDDPAAALESVPPAAPRIVFMHNPQSFPRIDGGAAPLALAGHTHGGQIRIPFLPSWSWVSVVRDREVHTDGWVADFGKAGNRLYVNRGIGFSKIPVRLNCRPEITYITLHRAQDAVVAPPKG